MAQPREPGESGPYEPSEDGLETLAPVGDWDEPEATQTSVVPSERYEALGTIDAGGMGVVRRVRDRVLNRTLAMKVLHRGLVDHPDAIARFLEEAQATAQLQHPGIVPVHDAGVLPDGRPWFTMREIKGRRFGTVIRELHAASGDRWGATPDGWTFRRLVAAFHDLCETVGFAHERGVVHRDLKPDNIMVGAHGEVLVLDWGLAKVLGAPTAEARGFEPVSTDRSTTDSLKTHMGTVAGTPAYMAPEQARGEVDRIDARSDVYALGPVLYHVLSGRPPYDGRDGQEVIAQVLSGPPTAVGRGAAEASFGFGLEAVARTRQGPPVPEALVDLCETAMAREPDERYASARELGERVLDWLDGMHRREQGLALVSRALEGVPAVDATRSRAAALDADGRERLAGLATAAPEAEKAAAWALLDEANELVRAADLDDLAIDRALHAALQVAPGLPEAHAALCTRNRVRHAEAERAGRTEDAARYAAELAHHARALPLTHPDRASAEAWLGGEGRLTLHTEPAGLPVALHPYATVNRRLVLGEPVDLGFTPVDRAVAMGAYLAVLDPDGAAVRVPVQIGRQEGWDTVDAAGTRHPVRVVPTGPNEVLVPAGWARLGGDPDALFALRARRRWLDAFVVQRFPVTVGAYFEFLNALLAEGRRDEALAHAPRERPANPGERGALLAIEGPSGFAPPAGGTADWAARPDHPVTMVCWADAWAYAAWLARTTGLPWRLPGELEWEKAARGDDGRTFPWGWFGDPAWCHVQGSAGSRRLLPVGSYATDESPYGVRDCGGGVRDWCAEVFGEDRPGAASPPGDPTVQRVCRGGGWDDPLRFARVCSRPRNSEGFRDRLIGFRLVRSV
ncbi:MAG: SUMF1/EgtB/PvdO family nonheme iron enzyme [Alphaproteobacteria bacterium]|nr:SUMF1/EgtB/PvdO family nonheme iron enzyme [Alphaproteobacteria bacterium]